MNLIVNNLRLAAPRLDAPVSEVETHVTAWPVAPGALLLVGRTWQSLPRSGHAQLENRRADSGPFRAYSWPLHDEPGGTAYVAAVKLPLGTYLLPGQTLFLTDSPTQLDNQTELRLPASMAGSEEFINAASALLEGAARAIGTGLAQFLLATFPPSATRRVPVIGTMLVAVLAELAVEDGCVELMGAIPGACGFLQGWGGPLPQDPQEADGSIEAVLAGDRVVRCRVRIATFVRPDIVPPSGGMVLVVNHPTDQGPDPAVLAAFPGLEQVYLLTDTGVVRRTVLEPRLLNPADSSGHIRDILPALSCPPRAADCLRLALRPRFAGRETFSTQKLPVRAAIDDALVLPAEGAQTGAAYVCGWLFDPLGLVNEVTLRSVGRSGGQSAFAARLDEHWTLVERPDVTKALTEEGFPPAPNDLHGFAAYTVGAVRAGDAFFLDVAFTDGTCAFLPMATSAASDPASRRRVLQGTDLFKPSGISVIERQLGPFFLALMRRPPVHRPAQGSIKTMLEPVAVAVVIPLVGPPVQPRAVLSQFLHDSLRPDEALLFVCGANWGDGAMATLRRTLAFMGLDAQVLHAGDVDDPSSVLDVAAAYQPASHYLLLDPATSGTAPGWRQALRQAVESASQPAVACPTLLYEDLSIRFAGPSGLALSPIAPYASVTRKMAGMPAAFATSRLYSEGETVLGTLACCLIPNAVLHAIGGAHTSLPGRFGQETGFFLRLHAAGIACLWVPQASAYAPDVADPATALEGEVGRLVDGWCLREAQQNGLFRVRG